MLTAAGVLRMMPGHSQIKH